ncbi:MAG: LysR family transcriptional regulator [Candidatus Lokiarchaeota archaeon]
MNIRYIKNFIKLAKIKNFSECANYLSISQSTLSHQVSQIEEDLGNVKLIDRTTKKFEITEAGNIFLNYATQIIELYAKCEKDLKNYSKIIHESITISASTIPGSYILSSLIADYKTKHPNVNFKIHINNSQESIDNVLNQNADFGGIGSFLGYNPNEFDFFMIGSEELKFICSPDHKLLKKQESVPFAELVKYPFVIREKGSGIRDIFQQKFKNYSKFNFKLEMNDNDSIISLVSETDYISIMSEMMAVKSEKANLIKILTIKEYPIIAKRDLYFIKRKLSPLNNIKKNFWNFISEKSREI